MALWLWRVAFALSTLILTYSVVRVFPDLIEMELSDRVCNMNTPTRTFHLQNSMEASKFITSQTQTKLPEQLGFDVDAMRVKLKAIEGSVIFYHTSPKSVVIAKDISFGRYYAQRDLQGWTMAFSNFSFEVFEQSFRTAVKLSDFSVFVCLGIQSQDKHCIKPPSFRLLTQDQKYNQIHGLRDILWKKDAFCFTLREALSSYRGRKNFTFPCWVLPMDLEKLRTAMENTKNDWIVKPSGQGEGHGIYVVNSLEEITAKQTTYDNLVVQPLLKDPCLVNEKKFDFRTYVLVTSITPLRAYIYKEGLVRLASSKFDKNAAKGGKEQQFLTNTSIGKKYTHLANLTWTFGKLKHYFEQRGVNSGKVFEDLNEAIVRTLLASEYRFNKNFAVHLGGYDCQNCYQLLGVDVILDSHYQPIVIEVCLH